MKLIALLLLTISPTISHSRDLCPLDAMTAQTFMRLRQGGEPLDKLMTQFSMPEAESIREVILDAFEMPLMMTAETRKIVVAEFRNKWSLRCYREGSFMKKVEDRSDIKNN